MGGFPSAVMQNAGRQPDPYETVGNALKLKQAMAMAPEQLKAAQLENQQRGQAVEQGQMDIDSQKAIHKAFVEANGDYEKAIPLAMQYGAKPDALMKMKQASLQTQQENLKLIQAKGDRAIWEANQMQGAHDAVTAAKPEDRAQVYQQALQGLQQAQVDVSHLPPQYPGDDAMKTFGAVLKGHTQGLEEAAKVAGLDKAKAETEEKQANTAKLQAELNFYKAKGMAPGVPMDAQEAADWLGKNPGKGPADYMKMKAGLTAQANASAQAGMLTDAAKQMAAQNYAQTGQLPAGMRSPAMSAQVLNKAAAGEGGVPNVAANKANYQADSASLKSLQKNFDQVSAFENTAGKNLDVFLKQAQKVVDSGSPWINKPLRSISGGLGGEDQVAFNAARTTALTEIAKVLNSSNASGVLSDSARHEVEGLIGPGATLKQVMAAANVLKQDMGNRHQAYADQIKEIKSRGSMGGQPAAAEQPQPQGNDFWSKFPKVKQ